MTYATVEDVATRLGRPISDDAERAQVGAWLEDIEQIIRGRLPDLDERVASGKPSEVVVTMLEANAVMRLVRNPDGKIQERIDDYSYGLNQTTARGYLYLTDDEWALLTPGTPDGAWTIRPYAERFGRGYWVHPDVWVPLP